MIGPPEDFGADLASPNGVIDHAAVSLAHGAMYVELDRVEICRKRCRGNQKMGHKAESRRCSNRAGHGVVSWLSKPDHARGEGSSHPPADGRFEAASRTSAYPRSN